MSGNAIAQHQEAVNAANAESLMRNRPQQFHHHFVKQAMGTRVTTSRPIRNTVPTAAAHNPHHIPQQVVHRNQADLSIR